MSKRIEKLIKKYKEKYNQELERALDTGNPDDLYYAGVQRGVVLGLKMRIKK